MIRKISINIIKQALRIVSVIAVISTVFAACSDNFDLPIPDEPTNSGESGFITVSINSSDMTTRADEAGKDELHENLINSVTLCLSPSAGDKTDDKAPTYMQTFTDLDAKGGVTLRIPLTMELRTRLFGENSSNSCNIFAAVNVQPGEAKTVEQLRNMVIKSEFETKQIQPNFTMDGDGVVTYNSLADIATADVKVKRSAAKFTLALALEEIEDKDEAGGDITWKPNFRGMSVMLQQGVKTSTLDPKPTPDMNEDFYFNSSSELNGKYTFKQDPDAPAPEVSGLKYKYDYVQETPLYSYPNQWTGNDGESHGTYLLLTIPWSCDEGKTYRTCYYHVPVVPAKTYETVRNISYHINLHVAVLGSFVPEEPMEVEADYYAADWGSEDLDVDIKDYRYLVVDQNEFTVNNENTYSIPFYTSHPTKVISCTMTYYRYNFSDQGSEFEVTVNEAQNNNTSGQKVFNVEFDNKNNLLNITHDLVIWTPYNENNQEVLLTRKADGTRADIDNKAEIKEMLDLIKYYKKKDPEEAEYSRIKFEIAVQHIDVSEGETQYDKDKDYIERITVWQYPGMYITAVQNYCDNLQDKVTANATFGNTFINGNTSGENYRWENNSFSLPGTASDSQKNLFRRIYNYRNWDVSIGLGFPPTYFNWNPNLYLVTITQISEELGEKYIIDDPRSYNINNDLSNNWGTYTVDEGTSEVFQDEYYYFNSNYQYLTSSKGNPITPKPSGTDTEIKLTGFITAPALGETQERTLKYYYPTREAENNKNTIAPKFRICSSYAGTAGYLTREMARRRAAAYQELGYPAGRWRLATFGEIEYCMRLAAEQKIPRLFGTSASGTWYYWSAQGAVAVPDATAADQTIKIVNNLTSGGLPIYNMPLTPFSGDNYLARTRFVYDEWYWGSETLTPSSDTPNSSSTIYTFTWGDQPKTNPEN
ncbi:MAG: hypothetical protein HDS35_08355 [Bacteroides sp.]|nr:hypothetical protein [Bacteroides sp.]